jgi:hypothetical protein
MGIVTEMKRRRDENGRNHGIFDFSQFSFAEPLNITPAITLMSVRRSWLPAVPFWRFSLHVSPHDVLSL